MVSLDNISKVSTCVSKPCHDNRIESWAHFAAHLDFQELTYYCNDFIESIPPCHGFDRCKNAQESYPQSKDRSVQLVGIHPPTPMYMTAESVASLTPYIVDYLDALPPISCFRMPSLPSLFGRSRNGSYRKMLACSGSSCASSPVAPSDSG